MFSLRSLGLLHRVMISRLMDSLFHLLLYAGELFKLKACF